MPTAQQEDAPVNLHYLLEYHYMKINIHNNTGSIVAFMDYNFMINSITTLTHINHREQESSMNCN